MLRRATQLSASLLFLGLLTSGTAHSADVPVKDLPVKEVKKPKDIPFFLLVDDRLTYSYLWHGKDPGTYSINPNGTINSNTVMQYYSFTHFDIWQYGTNFLSISYIKSDHNDPANPCTNSGSIFDPGTGTSFSTSCAGATDVYGFFRSTFGWNEIFDTKQFTQGPLHNISFEVGGSMETENNYLSPANRSVVAGLQFAFDLPYKGYINFAPLMYWEFSNHNGYTQCGGFGGPIPYPAPNASCLIDGDTSFKPTWAVEINYYLPLGFLPESINYFSLSGRAGWYGPKGTESNPLPYAPPFNINKAVELNSEPIRLTFDASKAMWGQKYSHFVDVWVAYKYWQNMYGNDHAHSSLCITGGVSNGSCTESSVYSGITVKF